MKKSVSFLLESDYGSDLWLAVTRRGTTDRWGLPGGKIDPGETAEQAVIREVFEETGLTIKDPRAIYVDACRGEVDYVNTTFVSHEPVDLSTLKTEPGCELAFVTREAIINGPFGDYNRALFHALDVMEAMLSDAMDGFDPDLDQDEY